MAACTAVAPARAATTTRDSAVVIALMSKLRSGFGEVAFVDLSKNHTQST
jgi:hypothetical protein